MNKKLGKGLGAIFGNDIDDVLNEISANTGEIKDDSKLIKISEIRPNPYQPRKDFDNDGLKELADSIKEHGVFNPILVRKSLKGYELVAGERRLRASKLAGLKEIPVIIKEIDDKGMMEISILENIQRKDLTPIEEANAYEQLIKKLNYTQEDLAKRIGKSRTYVTNMLRLLKLPHEIRELVGKEKLSYGHARALINVEDEDEANAIASRAVKEGLSVREVEKLVKNIGKKKPVKRVKEEDPFIKDLTHRLMKKYSTEVEITNKAITIKYNGVDDLNRILEIMDALEEE